MPREISSPDNVDLDRVFTIKEWTKRIGIAEITAERLIKRGEGPTLTRLSPNRIGIRERHHREWLDRRAVKSGLVV